MDKEIIEAIRAEGDRGIAAVKRRQADQAGIHFNNALDRADEIEDDRTRRDELAVLALLFGKCGFPDLALMAAEEAVDLDRTLGLTNLMAQDLLSVANAHVRMENTAKAEAHYQEAMNVFMEQKDFANAASANTNLAGIVANRGDMARAIELLEKSLEYLARKPFDHTEIQTRFALLQAMEIQGHRVDLAIENAKQLCSRFLDKMPADQRKMTKEFVGRAVDRHLAAHPEVAAAAWKTKNFPEIYA